MSTQKKSKAGSIVVIIGAVGCGGILILGILAALAIPAFLQYIQRSKAAEAPVMVSGIAYEVRAHFEDNCEFPPSLPALVNTEQCCGGLQCDQDSSAARAWTAANIRPPDYPTYFSYHTERVDESAYIVRAVADFGCGGANHTYEVRIEGSRDGGGCTAELGQGATFNDLQ